MYTSNHVLKLSDSNIQIELNKNNRIQESVMFTSLKSIVDYYKDSYSYKNKSIDKFIQVENKIDENDLSVYQDDIQCILENSFYACDIRYTGTLEIKHLIERYISWERVNEKGKFIKRLKKFIHSNNSLLVHKNTYYEKCLYSGNDYIKFDIPEFYIQKINEVINSKIDSNNKIIFDISNEDYRPGLYKESDSSCWWDSYDEGRLHFINDAGFSIRRYKANENNFYPMGRVWAYLDYINNSEVLVIFNLYDDDCKNINKYSEFIIKALTSLTGRKYFCNEVTLHSPYSGNEKILWINGNRAVIISNYENKGKLQYENSIDFNNDIFSDYDKENYYTCENCNCRLYDEDDFFYSENDGCIYCEECYSRLHGTCIECGTTFHNSELITIGSGYDSVCQNCYSDYYFTCDNCNEVIHTDNCIYDELSDSNYCEDCYSEMFTACKNCGVVHNNDDFIPVKIGINEFKNYCPDCIDYDENINKCIECGIYCDNFQLSKIDNKFYCINCEVRIGLQVK